MSIIIAIISCHNGIVASDGRIFESVKMIDKIPIVSPGIKSEQFDKTFSIIDGEFIGAFAGLMSFSGKPISEHVNEIISDAPLFDMRLSEVADLIGNKITDRLCRISDDDVIFENRKVDILLVGREGTGKRNVAIKVVRIYPKNNKLIFEEELIPSQKSNNTFKIFGNDEASKAAVIIMRRNSAPNKDNEFLKRLGKQAIRAGIRGSSVIPHGSEKACGGITYCRTLKT